MLNNVELLDNQILIVVGDRIWACIADEYTKRVGMVHNVPLHITYCPENRLTILHLHISLTYGRL